MNVTAVPLFVTLHQIAAVAGKHYITVFRQAKKAGLLADKPEGEQSHRIPLVKANRFIARTWPGAPLMKEVPPATSDHHTSDDSSDDTSLPPQ